MTAQTDPANILSFPVTPPGGETVRFAAAYLDINSDTRRYPAAPNGDGPFAAADCVSIRNIIRGQHQCMVAEVFYGDPAVPGSGDQTEPGATPATSDNLAQRNLLIIESANPGHPATRMVQHSFDIVLANRRDRIRGREDLRLQTLALERARQARNDGQPAGFVALAAAPVRADSTSFEIAASLARAPLGATHDEILFFWNNLPRDSKVEVYLPSLDVDYVLAMRQLRHAPQTVRFVDERTLSLIPDGVTYLPIPNLGAERVAGLLTVTLPDGIKAGQVYTVDVLQMRLPIGAILGAFRLTIPVSKALRLYAREARLLNVFEERLKVTSVGSRWHPILLKQVEYFRARAQQMAEEAADECSQPTGNGKGVRLRIIIEQIKVLDFYGPLVHGSGGASLIARVNSPNAGGLGATTRLPSTGDYPVSDRTEGYVIDVGKEIFRGTVVDALTVELWSAEPAEDKRTCHYRRVFKGKAENWLGHYKPSDERRDPENVGDWLVWYRIEAV